MSDSQRFTPTQPLAQRTNSAPVDSGAIGRLNEAESDDDGPECETCGKTTCPDADLPGFSEPRNCNLAPIYEAIRDAKDCDYGCARDLTNQEIRLFVAPAVDRIVREHTDRALAEAVSNDRRSTRIDACAHCGDLVISFGDGHWSHYRGPGSLLNRCQHSVPYGRDATPAKDGRYHQIVRAARQEQGR